MTDYSEFEEDWEPWHSTAYSDLTARDTKGVEVVSPFKGHGETFHHARLTMKMHYGIILRAHGFHPAWLKEK